MKPDLIPAGLLLLICFSASAATRYVNVSNSNPAVPYTSWATAATTIQDAVDAAGSGETILVTNGVYATGGRAVHGTMTNRVAVDKPVHLLSVNGPQFNVIRGYQVPGTTNGDGAIRCVYLTNGASLSGFTLTNGATRATNDYVKFHESGGGGVHCEALQSYLDPPTVVSNCIITGNSAFGPGGGVYGGGVSSAQIIDCELRGNTAQFGGGVAEGWVTRCLIADNAAENGGGASEAYGEAGGFEYYSCKLDNCLLVGNRAQFKGGGAYACELNNCTVVGNSAGQAGGGLFGFFVIQVHAPSRAVNSVVYSNTAPSDANFVDYACNLDNSCTTPLPGWGSANITNAPSFVDFIGGNFRLQSDSPCINSGTNYYAPGPFDLDGNPRVHGGTVDMGAYEFQQGSTGLVHYVNLLNANPIPPYLSWATAATNIQDAIDAASPGAEVLVTNGVYASGGRAVHGTMTNRVVVDKALHLRSVNGPQLTTIEGKRVPGINWDGSIRCVYLADGARLSGFTLTNGHTQSSGSVETERNGGGLWCESFNVRVTDCVITDNGATWYGGGAFRGTLERCSLTSNFASQRGGGVADAALSNCALTGNFAGYYGGGAAEISAVNCVLTGNSTFNQGGGAWMSALANCTLTKNSTLGQGGGVFGGSLINTIIWDNTATNAPNVADFVDEAGTIYSIACNYSCTIPMPSSGVGNTSSPPMFADPTGANLRLHSNSPCINTGNNTDALEPTDFDGNPRIVGGTVDMGAYEFQTTQPTLRIAQSGTNILLAWPLWASHFDLQQTTVLPSSATDWGYSSILPTITNGENTVTLPLDGGPKLFRLFKP